MGLFLLQQYISNALLFLASDCQKMWRTLRDRYARELKAIESGMGSGEVYKTSWPLFEILSFLKEYIRSRRYGNGTYFCTVLILHCFSFLLRQKVLVLIKSCTLLKQLYSS